MTTFDSDMFIRLTENTLVNIYEIRKMPSLGDLFEQLIATKSMLTMLEYSCNDDDIKELLEGLELLIQMYLYSKHLNKIKNESNIRNEQSQTNNETDKNICQDDKKDVEQEVSCFSCAHSHTLGSSMDEYCFDKENIVDETGICSYYLFDKNHISYDMSEKKYEDDLIEIFNYETVYSRKAGLFQLLVQHSHIVERNRDISLLSLMLEQEQEKEQGGSPIKTNSQNFLAGPSGSLSLPFYSVYYSEELG